MIGFTVKKRPLLILYLALVLMGTSTFAVIEPFYFGDFEARGPISEGFLSRVDYTIDCLAVSAPVIGRTKGASFSPRSVPSPGPKNIGTAFLHVSLNPSEKPNQLSIKDTILLKLRI